MSENLPISEYYDYYGPEYKLPVLPKEGVPNQNTDQYLENVRIKILERLSNLIPAPSVAFHERAPDMISEDAIKEESMVASPGRPSMKLWRGDRPAEGFQNHIRLGTSGVDLSYRNEGDMSPSATLRRLGSSGVTSPRRPNMLRQPSQE